MADLDLSALPDGRFLRDDILHHLIHLITEALLYTVDLGVQAFQILLDAVNLGLQRLDGIADRLGENIARGERTALGRLRG